MNMPVEHTEQTTILQIVQRAASDPSCDIDKMERLMQMHERMQSRQSEQAFNDAMSSAQAKMRPVSADATNPQTRSQYATYGKLDKALRHIYTDAGFSLSYDTEDSPKADHVRVLCYVSHRAGHTRTYKADMPSDGKGAKGNDVMTKTHAFGAGASYGMRYLLKMIFNVAIGEDDDDGNSSGRASLSELAVTWIESAGKATGEAELSRVWADGVKSLNAAKDASGYDAFKSYVTSKGAQLKAAKDGAK